MTSSILTMPDTPGPNEPTTADPMTQALDDYQIALAVQPDLPQLMTTQEVAKFFRVTDDTVRTWVTKGSMPATRLEGDRGHLRFRRADVLAFMAGRPAAHACGCGPAGGPNLDDMPYDPRDER